MYPVVASTLVGPVVSEATLGHLPAVRLVYSTTDDEAESQRSHALQSKCEQEHGLEEVILEVEEGQVDTNSG